MPTNTGATSAIGISPIFTRSGAAGRPSSPSSPHPVASEQASATSVAAMPFRGVITPEATRGRSAHAHLGAGGAAVEHPVDARLGHGGAVGAGAGGGLDHVGPLGAAPHLDAHALAVAGGHDGAGDARDRAAAGHARARRDAARALAGRALRRLLDRR